MLISAKLIKKSRKEMRCELCRIKLEVGKQKLRLYGSAGTPDPPYVIYVCITCIEGWEELKVQAILKNR